MTPLSWHKDDDPERMIDCLESMNAASLLIFCDAAVPSFVPPFTQDRTFRLFSLHLERTYAMGKEKDLVLAKCLAAERWIDGEASLADVYAARYPGGVTDDAVKLHSAIAEAASWVRGSDWICGHRAYCACLLREVVGDPFRPTLVPPSGEPCLWLTPTVSSLALAAYRERLADLTLDPVRLAVLADALEEDGIVPEGVLRHLRGEAPVYREVGGPAGQVVRETHYRLVGWRPLLCPHVRGCWVLDRLLMKGQP